jgi:hypothetical protein
VVRPVSARFNLDATFSCKTRYFCPSYHQRRVLLYGEWVEEHVLAPVPHRQGRSTFSFPP